MFSLLRNIPAPSDWLIIFANGQNFSDFIDFVQGVENSSIVEKRPI